MNTLIGKDKDGRTAIILILEPGNIHRMVSEAKPIELRVDSLFPEGIPQKLTLFIAHSETPVADGQEFQEMAEVGFDERSPKNAKRRPHCPECRSTIEQLAVWRNESPMALTFCAMCGCVFGMVPSDVPRKVLYGQP